MADSSPIITQRDLARILGVSNATISLALRDSPRIAESRRKEIQTLAEQLGYRPNSAATTLSYQKRFPGNAPIHASLGWLNLWPNPEDLHRNPYFGAYWLGAEACARKFGFHLDEIPLSEGMARRVGTILKTRGIEGLLLSPELHPHHVKDLRKMDWDGYSVVRTGRFPTHPPFHLVTANQNGNTIHAFDRILALGYRRVGFVGYGVTPADRNWAFENGYLTVQRELPANRHIPVYHLDASDSASTKGLGAWVGKYRPDALLTSNIHLRETLEKLGLKVPDDIGLATVNIQDCGIDAGIDQNPLEIGRCALLQLISLIHDNERGVPASQREILITGNWVDGSCLPPRSRIRQDGQRGMA
jgi:DNA-binding LacI/PurR family transcriptional regulator